MTIDITISVLVLAIALSVLGLVIALCSAGICSELRRANRLKKEEIDCKNRIEALKISYNIIEQYKDNYIVNEDQSFSASKFVRVLYIVASEVRNIICCERVHFDLKKKEIHLDREGN